MISSALSLSLSNANLISAKPSREKTAPASPPFSGVQSLSRNQASEPVSEPVSELANRALDVIMLEIVSRRHCYPTATAAA